MTVAHIIAAIEGFAPRHLQESWDNSGLQVGDPSATCTGVMLCVDVTAEVLGEAIARGCNMIVSHHPLIFRGLKAVSPSSATGAIVMQAVAKGIAIYSAHTSLDSTMGGVSYALAKSLGITPRRVLSPLKDTLYEVQFTVPARNVDDITLLLTDRGYTYTVTPQGGVCDITANIPAGKIDALMDSTATTPAGAPTRYTAIPLHATTPEIGLGIYGTLDTPLTLKELADRCRAVLGTPAIRTAGIADHDTRISRVALCGGSGAEFARQARQCGAQAYITGDIKYHDLADAAANPGLALLDVGHWESEMCAKDIFYSVLSEKFPNFVILKSTTEQNPVKYI